MKNFPDPSSLGSTWVGGASSGVQLQRRDVWGGKGLDKHPPPLLPAHQGALDQSWGLQTYLHPPVTYFLIQHRLSSFILRFLLLKHLYYVLSDMLSLDTNSFSSKFICLCHVTGRLLFIFFPLWSQHMLWLIPLIFILDQMEVET